MALFQKKIGTVFLKEDSDATQFIKKMTELETQVTDKELKEEIRKQIKIASYGLAGENNISFELKNSGIDMYVLHDIYLEYGDMSAQIDYLIITRKCTFIIECKNLIGNIEIDNQGNFIRTYEINGKKIKEGVYSPITQNQRHLEVLKRVRKEAKGNILNKVAFEKYFNDNYKPLIVLANPKTYLNSKFAKKEVKEHVIRADQVINKIKELNDQYTLSASNEKGMQELAQFFLDANISERSDYAKKYEELVNQMKEQKVQPDSNTEKICPKCGKKLVLRTASKGASAGNQFYGCLGFPQCRYIENL